MMTAIFYLHLLWVLTLFSSTVRGFPNRIVNGTDATPGEIPYIVSLKLGITSIHMCGGSILNEYWILTAAHCVYNFMNFTAFKIQYGVTQSTTDGYNTIYVAQVIYHENYLPELEYNDIALLKLKQPIEFNDYVQPINLPTPFSATPAGADALLAGWGALHTGGWFVKNLQKVNIQIYSDEDCEKLHQLTGPTDRFYNLCAGVDGGGKGQCMGDSGGPLVVSGVQVGIVSWSVKPCTVAPYPGVFTKVSSYVDWIRERIVLDKKR